MKKHTLYISLLLVSISWGQQTPAPKQNQSILLIGGTAHLGNGTIQKNSMISIIDGKIQYVVDGTLARPAKHDTIIMVNENHHIYPGFIAPNSTLGLVEIDAVKASDDVREMGEMNPHIRSIIAYNAESLITETTRPNGVLLAQITPRGGRISGTSSVVQLDAWNWEDAVIKADEGIHLNWPRSYVRTGWWAEPGGIEANKEYENQIKAIQDFFSLSSNYLSGDRKNKDISLEAMNGLQAGTKKLYVHADGEKEIRDALLFKQKNKIAKMVIVGGYYAFKAADDLKQHQVGVLLKRVHDLPLLEDEDVNLPYKNAALLVKKGVLTALQNQGDMERMQTRNLPFYAGTCASWGLTKEEALQLITSNAAEILGISEQYGTLEHHKSATLFISEGDALDMKTNKVTHAFIDGRMISLDSRQDELYERYKNKFEQQKK